MYAAASTSTMDGGVISVEGHGVVGRGGMFSLGGVLAPDGTDIKGVMLRTQRKQSQVTMTRHEDLGLL